jgi:hypothetical protein
LSDVIVAKLGFIQETVQAARIDFN